MEGRTLSHYHILERIGAGGMGVVYRARDERLHRDVALKLLPPGSLADADAHRRSRAEAVLLSQLNHPNVATVYDFDTQDGVSFIVLEFLTGESLARRLASGPLAEAEVVRVGLQVTDAVVAAHARGVIHRDLKPGNLHLLPDGRVKVLDFGLARLLQASPALSLTESTGMGTATGTVAYMAPEVLAGKPADARSDLYALGVVLYEMAVGRAPFTGESLVALMYAVLNQSPPAPRSLRPHLSPGFEALVLRAMERDPERRHGSAVELREELAAIAEGRITAASPADPPPIRSLAVLPLENLSGDPAQEFFADGMTDALISGLAKIRGLRVISRTSAMRHKGTRKPLSEIASELRVDAVVEGSVARSGERVRINAQLIHAASDTLLWGESYERELRDVLAIQGEVARAVADEIRAAVLPATALPLQRPESGPATPKSVRRVDPAAFDEYLHGLQNWQRRTEDALRRAVERFDAAIRLDPDWALAHAGLAQAWAVIGFYGHEAPSLAFPLARAAAERALALDETVGEAHSALGYVLHYYDWNRDEAEREYLRGIELSPSSSVAHLWYVNLLATSGRSEEGRAHGREALAIDPLAPVCHIVPGWVSFFAGEFDRAIVEMGRARELDPTFWSAQYWYGWAHLAGGHPTEALPAFEEAARLSERNPEAIAGLACGVARLGDERRARALLADIEQLAERRFVSGFYPALVYVALGDHDAAFASLELAVTQRTLWLMWLNVDPRLDPLRGDPRFEHLKRKVEIAPRA